MTATLRRCALLVVLAAVAAFGVVLPSAHADEREPLRILVAGDSISHGFDGDYTWRYRLWQGLSRAGVPHHFVGQRTDTYGPYADYLAPFPEPAHGARGGITLHAQMGVIRAEVEESTPHVLVAIIGHNDLYHGATPDRVGADIETYVTEARAARPNLKIVLGQIKDAAVWRTGAPLFTTNKAANERIAEVAARLSTPESPIVVARINAGWKPMAWTSDGVHPNPTGEAHIAQRVADALHEVGATSVSPTIARSYAWRAPMPVRLKALSGHRLLVTYNRMPVRATSVRLLVRRVGGPARVRVVAGHSAVLTHLRAGAVYTVRALPVRRMMVGVYGAPVRARVLRP